MNTKQITFEDFIGFWRPNCEFGAGFIHIKNRHQIDIEVNLNQIYISSIAQFDPKNDALTLFLKQPEDLGIGGLNLTWNVFSTDKPIAKMTLHNDMQLEWLGFFNNENEEYQWIEEADIIRMNDEKMIHLKKCNHN